MQGSRFIMAAAILLALACTPALAADYPPGLSYSSLLNGVKLLNENGQFTLDNIRAVFLPDPNNGEYLPYNPDNGAALWAILSTADGKGVYRFDFYVEKLESPYWLLGSYKAQDLRSGADVGQAFVDLAQPGQYVLDFFLDSGKFCSFPFSVAVLKSSDPFAGGDWYVLDGPWADWGYLFYSGADPEQSLVWKMWLRTHEHGKTPDVRPRIEVRDSAGKLVCTSREGFSLTLDPPWIRYEFDMVMPAGSEVYGQYFKAKDLLARDGAYTLTLTLDGKLYGSWKFNIKGGKPVYAGRAIRGAGDPLAFVEGGRDAFWYERE